MQRFSDEDINTIIKILYDDMTWIDDLIPIREKIIERIDKRLGYYTRDSWHSYIKVVGECCWDVIQYTLDRPLMLKILLLLYVQPMHTAELVRRLGVCSSSVLHALGYMWSRALVDCRKADKKHRYWTISDNGKVVLLHMRSLPSDLKNVELLRELYRRLDGQEGLNGMVNVHLRELIDARIRWLESQQKQKSVSIGMGKVSL